MMLKDQVEKKQKRMQEMQTELTNQLSHRWRSRPPTIYRGSSMWRAAEE